LTPFGRGVRAIAAYNLYRHMNLTVSGLENVPKRGGALLAARHTHHLFDGVALDWNASRRQRWIMETARALAEWPLALRGDNLRAIARERVFSRGSPALRSALDRIRCEDPPEWRTARDFSRRLSDDRSFGLEEGVGRCVSAVRAGSFRDRRTCPTHRTPDVERCACGHIAGRVPSRGFVEADRFEVATLSASATWSSHPPFSEVR